MNKADIIIELSNIMADIKSISLNDHHKRIRFRDNANSRLSTIIAWIIEGEEDCQSCPVVEKIDRLADAIEQATFISKTNKEPFKVEYKVPEINLHSRNAAKAAKFADKIRERYGLTASKISPEKLRKWPEGVQIDEGDIVQYRDGSGHTEWAENTD